MTPSTLIKIIDHFLLSRYMLSYLDKRLKEDPSIIEGNISIEDLEYLGINPVDILYKKNIIIFSDKNTNILIRINVDTFQITPTYIDYTYESPKVLVA